MVTNADITIYNRKLDPETRTYVWLRTIISSVWWHTEQKVQITDNGLQSADIHKIRIPKKTFPDGYLPPEEYARIPLIWAEKHWTVENGDLFVKGIVTDGITKESDLQNKGYQIGKVLSHSENFFGGNPHIRIGGA